MDDRYFDRGIHDPEPEPPPGYGLHPVIRRKRLVKAAEGLGESAFAVGKDRMPMADPILAALLEGLGSEEGQLVLKTWLRSWDEANLSDDPPAWALGQDPDHCETCGSLLEEAGADVRCPTCDGEEEPCQK